MKRLMRKQSGNRRGGDSNRDGTVLDSAPAPRLPVNELPVVRTRQNHSPKSPTAWTSNTEAGVQQQQQHHQRQRQEGMAKLEPISHMTRGLSAPSTLADSGGDDGTLPTAWRIDIMSLRHSDPLCICMNSISKATVCSNRPVVTRQLKIGADVYPGRPKPGDYHTQVYYFEVSIICNQLSSAAGIVIGFMNERGSVGIGPGEVANSIGWGSDGLLVNGRRLDAGQNSCFRDGDVIGCGMEIGGMYSVFFTMNGQMVIPPSAATAFVSQKDLPWYPATSFRHGNGSFLMGNFGIDPRTPFRWQGSNQLNILSTQGAGWSRAQTVSFSHLPTASTSHVATSHAESAEQFQQPFPYSSTTPSTYRMESRHNDSLSRSMPESITQSTNSSARPFPNSTFSDEAAKQPSYFGERNHHKSLEDDDPATMSAALHDHFNLQPSATGSKLPATSNVAALQVASWSSPRAPLSVQSTTTYPAADPSSKDNYSNRWHERGNESRSRREQNRKERLTRRTDGRGLSGGSHSPTTSCSSLSNSSHYPPRSTDSSSVPDTSRMDQKTPEPVISETRIASRTLTTGNEVPIAKEHAQALIKAAKQITFDGSTVHTLLEMCKADQEKLQLKLSNALEEADAIENLEELFAVNDEICVAINAGNQALEREKMLSKKKKKKSMDGPAIQLLVENEDIFSLICMLRASNEKRIQAALALMRFARGNESLRNEIRSSGGMHSFLTLFRTKGTSEPLKVISSMAMAYILPSFVASSQTSASVGLKIIECLRYLVISSPVETVDYAISRPEMLKAASMGVNVLWINAIQPLLILESTKVQSSQVKPELRPSASLRISRVRERAGGSLLDQGQESIELHELTELAVTLITHVAKISDSPSEEPLDVGYNIVEQVCEVDVARPIAVREGLLTTLVEWVRSNQMEKVRPAASALRYLISINDQYMAGWIHSQVVSEGAVNEIVKLLNQSVGHDTRVAVAQMLSALCVAPHTRAAVVGAKCVSYLVALLYEHTAPASAEMVYFAATSLLQLAAGAMIRAAASLMNDITVDAADRDHHEAVINEILEGWAHGLFVQITLEHSGKLRSVSVEALRVLSEDTNLFRQTRLQLCSAGAAEALGRTLKDYVAEIRPLMNPKGMDPSDFSDPESKLFLSVKDVHEALRGLANILEPQKETSQLPDIKVVGAASLNPKDLLVKGCLDLVQSGGLECIMWVSSLPDSPTPLSDNSHVWSADRMDLLEETCRLLANLSPLLLTDAVAYEGCSGWASAVYDALHGILVRIDDFECDDNPTGVVDIIYDALKGLGALARYEPLKIRIVDKSLPALLALMSISDEKNDLSNAASQVLLSLGFTEDEITVQVAGNNPKLLVDWFCLQRSLLLQAMARTELRAKIVEIWHLPFSDIDAETAGKLRRQISTHSNLSSQSDDRSDQSEDNMVIHGLFENFTRDRESYDSRDSLLEQYHSVYMSGPIERAATESITRVNILDKTHLSSSTLNEARLLKSQMFPLNDTQVEKDWVLSHYRALESADRVESKFCSSGSIPERIESLFDCCFPSRILRNDVIPFNDLRTQSSFNFRALLMPQRRYFSFRREGQLLARLCEKQAGLSDTVDVHWSLGFTNSTFAGEFVESLVQTLYLCPMITGLSFSRNSDWLTMRDVEGENEGEDGGLLANLAGSLPPWVSYLTFDNVLQDRDLRALVAIIDTMGKLSSGNDDSLLTENTGSLFVRQSQGKFAYVGIRNSPQISKDSWNSFFSMLGRSGASKRGRNSMPLSSLMILDLSGNKLGDEMAARVLELVHDKDSGCNLEQLDLSGNRIGRGTNMVRVFRSYTEYYRYNQKLGAKMVKSGWKSSLQTLILADNDLFLGQAGLEIFALLKHDALCLRFLDLSNNGLEGDIYQLVASSLLKNTSLCHLDLSSNKFSLHLIDLIMEKLNGVDAESNLSFLLLEDNSPSLTSKQRQDLGKFLRKSRKNAIMKLLHTRDDDANEELATAALQTGQSGLELIDEGGVFDDPFQGRRRSLTIPSRASSLGDDGDNMITVLFSAPLVFADETNSLHPFAKLDFDLERELLWQCMKEASRDIELTFDTAHHSRLLATLTKRCSCLHYSGHGHPHFLPFEDGMGGPNWLNVQDIKELIVRDGAAPFKFVFVSACHSGLAGETFASAGVPHVVCCQQEQELKDTAALAFTRSFYLALAIGHTVKESFDQGCKAVRATPNLKDPEKEMEKFVLLPKDGNHDKPVFRAKPLREWPKQSKNHNVDLSKSRRQGSLMRMRSVTALGARSSELSTRNMMQDDPAPTSPQFFIGREVDMYYILTALLKLKKRLVNVLGEPGIGRSSLVCALCHYINERASTITEIQRIYFIKPKHGGRNVSCRSLLRQLLDKLQEVGKCRPSDDDTEVEGMLDSIARSLKNEKALIVFDRTELLEKSDDAQELPMILSTLLYETKQVKVILTGKYSLGQPAIGGQVEHPYNLGPLNFANSIRLFGSLCPHLHTPSERGRFCSALIHGSGECSHLFPGDGQMSDASRSIFSTIGDGVPSKIEKAAYSISKDDLNKLQGAAS